jgi:hypothetical protein
VTRTDLLLLLGAAALAGAAVVYWRRTDPKRVADKSRARKEELIVEPPELSGVT